jgi:hypothetical protein
MPFSVAEQCHLIWQTTFQARGSETPEQVLNVPADDDDRGARAPERLERDLTNTREQLELAHAELELRDPRLS